LEAVIIVLLVARDEGKEKLNVVTKYEGSDTILDIANATDIPESTLSTIRKHSDKIKKTGIQNCKDGLRLMRPHKL
jgi:hypothetical protein